MVHLKGIGVDDELGPQHWRRNREMRSTYTGDYRMMNSLTVFDLIWPKHVLKNILCQVTNLSYIHVQLYMLSKFIAWRHNVPKFTFELVPMIFGIRRMYWPWRAIWKVFTCIVLIIYKRLFIYVFFGLFPPILKSTKNDFLTFMVHACNWI